MANLNIIAPLLLVNICVFGAAYPQTSFAQISHETPQASPVPLVRELENSQKQIDLLMEAVSKLTHPAKPELQRQAADLRSAISLLNSTVLNLGANVQQLTQQRQQVVVIRKSLMQAAQATGLEFTNQPVFKYRFQVLVHMTNTALAELKHYIYVAKQNQIGESSWICYASSGGTQSYSEIGASRAEASAEALNACRTYETGCRILECSQIR